MTEKEQYLEDVRNIINKQIDKVYELNRQYLQAAKELQSLKKIYEKVKGCEEE